MSDNGELSVAECEYLVRLCSAARDNDMKGVLTEALFWGSRFLDAPTRLQLRRRAAIASLPWYFKDDDLEAVPMNDERRTPKEVDIAVMAVKPLELDACKTAFDIGLDQAPSQERWGARFWEFTVPSERSGVDRTMVLTMAGTGGNEYTGAFCHTLFRCYSPRLVLLVGMAGSDEDELDLGDVVAGRRVIDYLYGTERPEGFMREPRPFVINRHLGRRLTYFKPDRLGWHELLRAKAREALEAYAEFRPPDSPDLTSWAPSFGSGVIASGNRKHESGDVRALLDESDVAAKIVEMEGVGFAEVCEEEPVQWLVVRGVADHCNPDRDRDWQFLATLSAATAVRTFVQKDFLFDGETAAS